MRDCGILICIQLICPNKSIQAWQAKGIPVAAVETEDTKEALEEKGNEGEEQPWSQEDDISVFWLCLVSIL